MTHTQLNELLNRISKCNSILELTKAERETRQAIQDAKLPWFRDLWFVYKLNDAVYNRSYQLRPKTY